MARIALCLLQGSLLGQLHSMPRLRSVGLVQDPRRSTALQRKSRIKYIPRLHWIETAFEGLNA
jgi:hypothetical protein